MNLREHSAEQDHQIAQMSDSDSRLRRELKRCARTKKTSYHGRQRAQSAERDLRTTIATLRDEIERSRVCHADELLARDSIARRDSCASRSGPAHAYSNGDSRQ